MGIETALIIGAGASLLGGVQGFMAGNAAAKQARVQGEIQADESQRRARIQARNEAGQAERAEARQKVSFLKSGVQLQGSPLMVMEETRETGAANVDNILLSGAYGASSARLSASNQADQLKSQGRSAFLQGVGGAASSFAKLPA